MLPLFALLRQLGMYGHRRAFSNPLIERAARNGRLTGDTAKITYPATMRHDAFRFNGFWPRAFFETVSP
jgi:hypothetical protein